MNVRPGFALCTLALSILAAAPAQADTAVGFSHGGKHLLIQSGAKDDFIRVSASGGRVTVQSEADVIATTCDLVSAHEAVCEPKFRNWTIRVQGNRGDDHLTAATSSAEHAMSFFGAEGDDVILGGPEHDVIHGGLGNDHVNGADGADRILGEGGADSILGGDGADFLDSRGVQGKDVDRVIDCGGGRDRLESDAEDPKPKSC